MTGATAKEYDDGARDRQRVHVALGPRPSMRRRAAASRAAARINASRDEAHRQGLERQRQVD
jgi:hypothetical protein